MGYETGVGILPGNPLPSPTTGSVNGPTSSGWNSLLSGIGAAIPDLVSGIFGNPNEATVNNPGSSTAPPAPYSQNNTTTYLIIGGVVLAALVAILVIFRKK